MKSIRIIGLLALIFLLAACNQTKETAEETAPATEAATEATTEDTSETEVQVEKGEVDIDALLAEGKPVMLQFSQDGCPPCEQMLPLLLQVQEEYADRVIVRYVDVHANLALAQEYLIRMTPTQIFIDADGAYYEPENLSGVEFVDLEDGTRVVRHVGMIPEDLLRTYLDDLAAGE